MEQVLAPNFKFKTRSFDEEKPDPNTILIKGFKKPSNINCDISHFTKVGIKER